MPIGIGCKVWICAAIQTAKPAANMAMPTTQSDRQRS